MTAKTQTIGLTDGGARKPGTLDASIAVIPVQLDITDPASVAAAAAAAPDTTLLINNAGAATAPEQHKRAICAISTRGRAPTK